MLLQTLKLLLLAVLGVAVLAFVIKRAMDALRTRAMARAAHQGRMRFSAGDPADIPRRYSEFALMRNGHSYRATNVTEGRVAELHVRAFDFRYEVGHGARRSTRHYRVVAVESDAPLEPLLLWNDRDLSQAPLAARERDGCVGGWSYRGWHEAAAAARGLCEPHADAELSLECLDTHVMFFTPARRGQTYAIALDDACRIATGMPRRRAIGPLEGVAIAPEA